LNAAKDSATLKSKPSNQIGLGGAIAIGIASMLGAGVFVVFREAFAISASLFFAAIALAAVVATLNAASIYQLAKRVSRPGGVYAYSREYVGGSTSFVAGFAFVFGKIGSIAAIALVVQEYLTPNLKFWPAALAIVTLTLVNISGINRTAAVAIGLSALTTLFFGTVLASAASPAAQEVAQPIDQVLSAAGTSNLTQLVSAASVMFFAFAGYARVATLGDEVRNPKVNIPRAIVVALIAVTVIYLGLAFALLGQLGLSLSFVEAPFVALTALVSPWMPAWLVILVAACAGLGSMLALLAGVSRTAATMAEDRELPTFISLRNRFGAPWLAEVVVAGGAIGLTAVGQLSWVIGFSSFSVLLYYAIGHLSTWLVPGIGLMSRTVALVGFGLCALLALAVPGPAVGVSILVLILALLTRAIIHRLIRSGQAS
jgi:APA family basic amino acid/polyamine antiporter